MPKALEADKELVKSLYLQGVRPEEITRRTGVKPKTIMTWSYRGNWKDLISRTRQALEVVEHDMLSDQVAKLSVDVRRKLAEDLATTTDALPKHSTHLTKFNTRINAISTLATTAKTVFGWADNSNPSPINIAVLGVERDSSMTSALDDLNAQDNAIDVESTKESLTDQPVPKPKP